MPDNTDWQAKSPSEMVEEIEMNAAILASLTSPASAAQEMRRMATELDNLQPQGN